MKLEQIKAEILARRNEWANKNDDYETASFIAYDTCLNMLDQLEPRWYPYPEEKPPIDGYYLVTTTKRIVTIYFLRDSDWLYFSDVIAWAELPKPYKKEAK